MVSHHLSLAQRFTARLIGAVGHSSLSTYARAQIPHHSKPHCSQAPAHAITVPCCWLLFDRRKWSESECELCLWSAVLSVDGKQCVESESSVQLDRATSTQAQLMQAAVAMGERVGNQLRANGAEAILADIR